MKKKITNSSDSRLDGARSASPEEIFNFLFRITTLKKWLPRTDQTAESGGSDSLPRTSAVFATVASLADLERELDVARGDNSAVKCQGLDRYTKVYPSRSANWLMRFNSGMMVKNGSTCFVFVWRIIGWHSAERSASFEEGSFRYRVHQAHFTNKTRSRWSYTNPDWFYSTECTTARVGGIGSGEWVGSFKRAPGSRAPWQRGLEATNWHLILTHTIYYRRVVSETETAVSKRVVWTRKPTPHLSALLKIATWSWWPPPAVTEN